MQCGSNLFTTFLAFDCGGGLVSVPRSGMGASGGEGGASGLSRDELSCGVPAGACAQNPIPQKSPHRLPLSALAHRPEVRLVTDLRPVWEHGLLTSCFPHEFR